MASSNTRATTSPIALIPAREVAHSSRAVRSGALVLVSAGVYAAASEWTDLAPWDRYVARVHAVILRSPDSPLCLESAAALHGLPLFGDPGAVHVLATDGGKSRAQGNVQVHSTAEPRVLEEIGGVLSTSVADTVVDLARARHHAIGLAIADSALRLQPELSRGVFLGINEMRLSSRGRRHGRWTLERATPLSESALESVDRAIIEWLGFPPPELQVWLGRDRVDKWWPEYGIVGESDGDLKYTGENDSATALRDRHRRDARLFQNGARAVPHWGWSEAIAAEPLHAILASAGLRSVRPRNTAELYALRRALTPHSRRDPTLPARPPQQARVSPGN